MTQAAASTTGSSVTTTKVSVSTIPLPSEYDDSPQNKRRGRYYPDGVPALAAGTFDLNTELPSQSQSAQPSPITPTTPDTPASFDGSKYGMGFAMDPTLIKETLFNDDEETKKARTWLSRAVDSMPTRVREQVDKLRNAL